MHIAQPVQLNLNDPNDLTLSGVRRLIASGDDTMHNQLRVTKSGIAHFVSWSPYEEGPRPDDPNILFRLETCCAGNDYVGIDAAADDTYVRRIYNCLKSNWPNPAFPYIDQF